MTTTKLHRKPKEVHHPPPPLPVPPVATDPRSTLDKVFDWVTRDGVVYRPRERLVALSIARRMYGKKVEGWPTQQAIADQLQISRGTVKLAVAVLTATADPRAVFSVKKVFVKKTRRWKMTYRLLARVRRYGVPELEPKPDAPRRPARRPGRAAGVVAPTTRKARTAPPAAPRCTCSHYREMGHCNHLGPGSEPGERKHCDECVMRGKFSPCVTEKHVYRDSS